MSKHETPLTRRFWEEVGGTLIEEFLAVSKGKDNAQRLIDGVILVDEETRIAKTSDVIIKGKKIIVIQTKASRLGMYLIGQSIISRDLMKKFEPTHIRSVIVCNKDDSILRPIAESYGLEVRVF